MSNTYLMLYNIVQFTCLVILGLSVLYIFIFAFAGLFYRQKVSREALKQRKIAVLIPGYKEDQVILEVAEEALRQEYLPENFDVVIIADSFLPETIQQLKQLPIKVIEVSFELSTKSKALNKAMEVLEEPYDIAVILDADNIMDFHFLSKVNNAFEAGAFALQGHRTAKNLNTSLAILDAISEEINNHIFRKGHRVLGLSSAIIGSGMAFRYDYFKQLMGQVTAIGGFDKEIELKMLKAGYKIAYLDDALVFDEKVQKSEVFSNQRRRWLSAQVHYFKQDFLPATRDLLLKANFDYFDKALQFIQPPRILLLGAVLLFGSFFMVMNSIVNNLPFYIWSWILLVSACLLAFIFSVPVKFYNYRTLKALASLPKGMILMLSSLMKIKGANKKFIHTQHTSTKSTP